MYSVERWPEASTKSPRRAERVASSSSRRSVSVMTQSLSVTDRIVNELTG